MILRLNSPFFFFLEFFMSDIGGASGKFKTFDSSFLRKPEQKSADQKLRDVSDMYEKHFLREMMKAMRSTVHEGGFIQTNQAEKIFKEQLDDHYVDKWGERGGIGLSDLIYKQLVDKFGIAMGIKAPVAKPQGPLPFNNSQIKPFEHPGKKHAVSYRIDIKNNEKKNDVASVKAPWDGLLLGKKTLADNQIMLELEHDNGLKSQLIFKGSLSNFKTGEKLQGGDTIGILSNEAQALYWTVEKGSEAGPETVSE